jgi:hypothetical protein
VRKSPQFDIKVRSDDRSSSNSFAADRVQERLVCYTDANDSESSLELISGETPERCFVHTAGFSRDEAHVEIKVAQREAVPRGPGGQIRAGHSWPQLNREYLLSTSNLAILMLRHMKPPPNFVTLHPYFKARPGQLEAFKAGLAAFREKTATEERNLFYDFTINGDEIFCREGYDGAEALLAHLDNVGALLGEAFKIADVIRLEVHGPAAELEKLRKPLAEFNPQWFVRFEG